MASKKTQSTRILELEARLEELEERLSAESEPFEGAKDSLQQFCSLPEHPDPQFDDDISPDREDAIVSTGDKWVNGTNIHYFLFSKGRFGGSNKAQDVVRLAFQAWKDLGIGLTFTEVSDIRDSELRIGFLRGNGSWSYVGTVALRIGQTERTMNFGWDITQSGPNGFDTALHEIGHALGLKHEHQNPNAGIVWDREAVYDYFQRTQTPPWSRDKTDRNILNKLDPTTVDGSDWDPNSIMHYAFTAGLIDKPKQYRSGLRPSGGLSAKDIETARRFYPAQSNMASHKQLTPYESERLSLGPGEQCDFFFEPEHSRDYTFSTFGPCDTVIVLFEVIDGEPIYIEGDNDSGQNRNASFTVRLIKGRRYKLCIRHYYSWADGDMSIMVW